MALSADGVVEGVFLLMGCDDAIHARRLGSGRRAMRGWRPVVGGPSAAPGLPDFALRASSRSRRSASRVGGKSRGSIGHMWQKLACPAEAARGRCRAEVLRRLARPPRLERGTPGLEGPSSDRLCQGGYCREAHRCARGRFAAGSGESERRPATSAIADLRASVCREAGGLRGDDDRQLPVHFSSWRDADLHVVTESRQEVHQTLN